MARRQRTGLRMANRGVQMRRMVSSDGPPRAVSHGDELVSEVQTQTGLEHKMSTSTNDSLERLPASDLLCDGVESVVCWCCNGRGMRVGYKCYAGEMLETCKYCNGTGRNLPIASRSHNK